MDSWRGDNPDQCQYAEEKVFRRPQETQAASCPGGKRDEKGPEDHEPQHRDIPVDTCCPSCIRASIDKCPNKHHAKDQQQEEAHQRHRACSSGVVAEVRL